MNSSSNSLLKQRRIGFKRPVISALKDDDCESSNEDEDEEEMEKNSTVSDDEFSSESDDKTNKDSKKERRRSNNISSPEEPRIYNINSAQFEIPKCLDAEATLRVPIEPFETFDWMRAESYEGIAIDDENSNSNDSSSLEKEIDFTNVF